MSDEACIECGDLDETYCDQGVGCSWCQNRNLCLEDWMSCICGDGFLQAGEDCDVAGGDPNCLDCACINGQVPDGWGICVCDGDEDCDDGLACNGVETCDENGDCVGGTPVPCSDDSYWCNGEEVCDWFSDTCVSWGFSSPGGWSLGDNQYGQLGDGSAEAYRTDPYMLNSVGMVEVAAGLGHTLFVTTGGGFYTVGRNNYGQLGDGSTTSVDLPIMIESSGVLHVAAGGNTSLFVKQDGSLWGMGRNNFGQLAQASNPVSNPVQIVQPGFGVVKAAAGKTHTLYVNVDGSLFAMGRNDDGQLGIGHLYDTWWPVQVNAGGTVVDVAAGEANSAFILDDGTLKVMGANDQGQIGDPTLGSAEKARTPVTVCISNVRDVAVGASHILFVTDSGELYAMGDNEFGQLGTGDNLDAQEPTLIVASGVTTVAAGATYSLFVREYEDGVNLDLAMFGMGSTDFGQLGDDSQPSFNTPIAVVEEQVHAVAVGDNHNLFLRTETGSCLIDDSCFVAGATKPGESCVICDPNVSRTSWTVAEEDASCNDGIFCNGPDVCIAQECVNLGPALACDDGIGCTDDACNELNDRCDHATNDSLCDDSVGCTDDTCDATNDCQYTPNDGNCDDSVDCTDDTCDATNDCQYTPNNGNCDDGNFCNGAEVCNTDDGCLVGQAPCSGDTPYCYCDSPGVNCQCHADSAVDLIEFEAERKSGGVLLSWLTGSELQCGAFGILRCEMHELECSFEPECTLEDHTELGVIIPCEDDPNGAKYESFDESARTDAAWSYYLREYETDGDVVDYGPLVLPAGEDSVGIAKVDIMRSFESRDDSPDDDADDDIGDDAEDDQIVDDDDNYDGQTPRSDDDDDGGGCCGA